MIVTSLDLEMNQPSNKIIEVGACIGDTDGEIGSYLHKASYLIDPKEPISAVAPNDIVKLTGITDEMVRASEHTLESAHAKVVEYSRFFAVGRNMMTWGGNDGELLRSQLVLVHPDEFFFAPTVYDVKKLYQFLRQAQGLKVQSGLARSLLKCGMQFKGTKHRAADDAHMTLMMSQWISAQLKGKIQFKDSK